ncbi:hypothetical protein Tco_1327603 [Tanacetum coccineum]
MLESEAYKTYHAYATGEKIPKPKYVKNKADPESSPKKKSAQASKGKRLKTSTKVAKLVKKKQPATTSKEKGLNVLYEVALSEGEQIKLATKRILIQTHSSHTSGLGAHEGTGVIPGVPDVPTYNSDDEQISWKSSDEEDDDEVSMSKVDDDNADDDQINDNVDNEGDDDQDDDNEQTESDNDDDDFVHPKLSTFDEKERQDEEDKEEEWSDDEAYDEETQGVYVEGEELDEEETNEEDEVNELYRDMNVNLEGRDTKMTDAPQTNVQGFISNMLNPNLDKGIDSILNLNTESTSLVDVHVTTNVEMPHSYVTTLPPPPIPFIQPQQQTPVSTPTIIPTVSLIPGIVDTYLANKMNEAVKTVVQLQSDRLRDKAQAENEDFINTLDENMRKIIKKKVKDQVKEQVSKILLKIEKLVNDQLKAEVLTRSSNQAKTSHVVAANLSELELKKILIDKTENNKSIDKSIQQKTLYKALVDAYETNKDILETYGDTRRRARKEPESTSAPKEKTSKLTGKSKEGSKSHQKSTGKSAQAKEPIHADEDLEEPAQQEFDTGFTEDQPVDETTQHHDWFQKPTKPPTPDRDWNKTLPAKHGPVQPWINTLARNEDPLIPTYELMKGSSKSLVEIEYFLKEVCKATTDQLDWNNPEGQQYPHDLRKPLPLIPNSRGRRVIPFDHFINNDLAYLSGGVLSRTYATSESARDVYSRHRILAVTKLKIFEWHNYKQLDWITVRRDDDKLYIFKEADYNRLRLQDIEDMLFFLVQGKLTNLNVEERIALGVSLRMFIRSVVLRRRVEDL